MKFEELDKNEIEIIESKTLGVMSIDSDAPMSKIDTKNNISEEKEGSFKFDKESMILDEVQISGRKAKRKKNQSIKLWN